MVSGGIPVCGHNLRGGTVPSSFQHARGLAEGFLVTRNNFVPLVYMKSGVEVSVHILSTVSLNANLKTGLYYEMTA